MSRLRIIVLGATLSLVILAAMASRTSAPTGPPADGAPADAVVAIGATPTTVLPQRTVEADTAGTPNAPVPTASPSRALTAALTEIASSTTRALAAAAADDDRTAYAAALRARDAGAYVYAALMFRRVAARGGTLSPIASLRHAQALASAGDRGTAMTAFADALARSDFPDVLRVSAHFDAADNAVALGDLATALTELARIRSDTHANSSDLAVAALEAAHIRHDHGDSSWVDEAISVVAFQPWSSQARDALDLLESDEIPVAPLAAAYVRYRAFQNEAARSGYERGLAGAAPSDAATAWFYLGALDERAHDPSAALAAYARSLSLAPAGALADDARYWRGRIFEDRGDVGASVAEYDSLTANFPDSSFTADARLRAAIQLALADDGARGADALERLRQITLSGRRADAAEAARLQTVFRAHLGLSGTPALDARAFDPAALPALLTTRFPSVLGATLTLPPSALAETPRTPSDSSSITTWLRSAFRPATPDQRSALTDHRFLLGRELMYVGEPAVGRAFFQDLLGGLSDRPDDLLAIAQELNALGIPDLGQRAAERLLHELPTEQRVATPRSVLSLAYPIAYRSALVGAASAYGLPPLLLAALVRQESAWNAEAVSSANALGLTQVTVPTGQQIASDLGVAWRSDLLFDPAVALTFGAYYLGTQMRTFDGNLAAAVAAYNAGPGSSSRWLDAQPLAGTDGFRLAVDFSETSRFISRVLENYAWYRYVYAGTRTPALP